MSKPDGLPEALRGPEEPPARFPFDRASSADVCAWVTVCPNVYLNGVPHSVLVYEVGYDADRRAVAAYRKDGAPMDPEPVAEEEDTDELLDRYLQRRRRYLNRELHPEESRPTTLDHLVDRASFRTGATGGLPPAPNPVRTFIRRGQSTPKR